MNNIKFDPIISAGVFIPLLIVMVAIIIINKSHLVTRLLMVFLLFIINERPMIRNSNEISYELDLDLMFVIDTTVSMNATDTSDATRLDTAKRLCNEIIKELPSSRVSVITYDNVAYMKYPSTQDYETILSVINDLKILNPFNSAGSSLTVPIKYLEMSLKSAAENSDYHDGKRQNYVFILGDGELKKEERLATNFDDYDKIVDLIDGGIIIGIGTEDGGKIKITEKEVAKEAISKIADDEGFLIDSSTDSPAISKMDEGNLKEFANKLNLEYIRWDSNKLIDEINRIKINASENNNNRRNQDKDIYYYFYFIILLLLLYELYYYKRNSLYYRRKEL